MADESDVNNGDDGEGQAANRSKVVTVPVHRSSHGIAPKEYLEENKACIIFDIHKFADLKEKRGEFVLSKTAHVCGRPFCVGVYPCSPRVSQTDVEYVSI